jgi:hypothetical protein
LRNTTEKTSERRAFLQTTADTGPAAAAEPGERLFGFYRERDHSCWLCELRDDGEPYGVEAQFFQNEELLVSRRFDRRMDPTRTPREMAIAWAKEERKAIEAYERETSSL